MFYRILTENVGKDKIEKIIAERFEGFTLYKAEGFWRLQKEDSLVIEIEAEIAAESKVNEVARAIKSANHQEAVMVQRINNNSWLV